MNQDEVRLTDLLGRLGIATTTYRHPPVFTVEENRRHRGSLPGGHCKCLFLADKHERLWLVVALEDQRLDLKMLAKQLDAGRFSFGNATLLHEVLGVVPGAVTPFAAMNDGTRRVRIVLDRTMLNHRPLHYHPLHNAATTAIAPEDLVRFLEAVGHPPLVVELPTAGEAGRKPAPQ
ncbi:MAG: prolyl-tRNA synthetase associated domain-containing protein [Alphaproteobacteria bacterium]|nr:prolyl-tRNA synthetase associated domain-containing protein [Alphaproteobacteria bacterium]